MRMKLASVAVLLSALVLSSAFAQEESQEVRFKSGEITFTILKSDGVTPVDGAEVKIRRTVRSKPFEEKIADSEGTTVIGLEAGEYVLNVQGRNISKLLVADDAVLSVCRVVLDDDKAAAVLAGGAAAAAATTAGAGAGVAATGAAVGAGVSTLVVGGVAVVVATGAGVAIYENNNDDDDDPEPEPTPEPTPAPRRRPDPTPTPTPTPTPPSPL
jgi:hypothetical protein